MKSKAIEKKQFNPLLVYIFIFTPFLGALSQHYQVFIVTIITSVVLFARWKYLDIRKIDLYVLIPVCLIVLFAFLSIFYGESHGDALYGFFHVITAVLFLVMLSTFTSNEKKEVLRIIPYVAAAMVVITAIAYIIPGLKELMYANVRMGGPFGYPNTFALYILIGLYIFLDSFFDSELKKHKITDYAIIIILLAGILFTGSRSIFIMTVFLLVYLLIVKKNSRIILIPIIGILAVAVGVYVFITNDVNSVGRFLTTSLESSTFLGRLLYDADALKMIVDRPYGYGYLGYYFLQHYYQTGVYSVRFVHNDWLQIALDFGVIAFLAFAWLYGLAIKRTNNTGRVILVLIGLHMLIDFDIQFFSVLMIMILCYNLDNKDYGKRGIKVDTNKPLFKGISMTLIASTALICLWMGVADFAQNHSSKDASLKIYPWAEDVKLHAMADTDDLSLQQQYANELVRAVPLLGQPYDVLSAQAMIDNDVEKAMDLKHSSVIYQKYNIKKYEEYAELLCDIIDKYKNVDSDIYNKAKMRLDEIPVMLDELEKNTNPIALKIRDVPEFSMSETVENRMKNI